MYLSTTPDFEQHLIPIRIPVDKNLGGYCVFLIRKDEQKRFAASGRSTTSPIQLRLGLGWIDVDILKANGFKRRHGSSYDGLFEMLVNRRFDVFLRAAVEVLDEYEQRKETLPDWPSRTASSLLPAADVLLVSEDRRGAAAGGARRRGDADDDRRRDVRRIFDKYQRQQDRAPAAERPADFPDRQSVPRPGDAVRATSGSGSIRKRWKVMPRRRALRRRRSSPPRS